MSYSFRKEGLSKLSEPYQPSHSGWVSHPRQYGHFRSDNSFQGSYPMHCGMSNSVSDLYPLNASRNPFPSGDTQKCHQTLPSVPPHTPGGAKISLEWTPTTLTAQYPSACKENGTVSSISLGHSQHNTQASKRKAQLKRNKLQYDPLCQFHLIVNLDWLCRVKCRLFLPLGTDIILE